jgi:hypothetical protein
VDLPACSVYTPLLARTPLIMISVHRIVTQDHEHAGHAHRAQRGVVCMRWSTHRLRNPCATRAYTPDALPAPSLHPQPGAVHSATAASPTQRQRYRRRRRDQTKRNKRTHKSMTSPSAPDFVRLDPRYASRRRRSSYVSERFASQKSGGEKERWAGRTREKRESRGRWGERMEQRRDLLPYRENEDREGPAAARRKGLIGLPRRVPRTVWKSSRWWVRHERGSFVPEGCQCDECDGEGRGR